MTDAAVSASPRSLWSRLRGDWAGAAPHDVPLIYMNPAMAMRSDVLGHSAMPGYREACGFFRTALFDRTGTLETGLNLSILDPIPELSDPGSLSDLCDARGAQIVAEAASAGLPVRLFWSGGIDSTAACVALLKALGEAPGQLEIIFNGRSVAEYRKFNRLLRRSGVSRTKTRNIVKKLRSDALLVTGEHGDQIFGSMLAEELEEAQYRAAWRDHLPALITRRLYPAQTERMLRFLEPQLAHAPVPVKTCFDVLWWWNFSMKWQSVSERMTAPLRDARRDATRPLMRHFFRTDDFQRWALWNPDKRIAQRWESYKWPLKEYIFEFTGDARYRDRKTKIRSLRGMLPRSARRPFAIDAEGRRLTQPYDTSLRGQGEIKLCFGEDE